MTGGAGEGGTTARSLTRSSTYTKLSDQAEHIEDFLSSDGAQDSSFLCCGKGGAPCGAELLLEAAFLSEETATLLSSYAQHLPQQVPQHLHLPQQQPQHLPQHPSQHLPQHLPHSSTCEKLCPSEHLAALRCGVGGLGGGSLSHPCLSHHHLYLHHLRDEAIQTESCPNPAQAGCPSDLDTVAEQRTFRSQACSPASTWPSDEELDSITMTTLTEPVPRPPPRQMSSSASCWAEIPLCGGAGGPERGEGEGR